MIAVMGATGRVGGAVARALLAAGQAVRVITRDPGKAADWAALGCQVARGGLDTPGALAEAFAGADAVFVVVPPLLGPAPGFPEARAQIAALVQALGQGAPGRVLCLSAMGAHVARENVLTQRRMLEQALAALPVPVRFLRPAWFLDNAARDVAAARDTGVIRSLLQPVDRQIAMVAVRDVAEVAARMLAEDWTGAAKVVELEGPRRVAPADLAAAFADALGRPVRAEPIPRGEWEALFRAQGMRYPEQRLNLMDGFNEGWIDAEKPDATVKGRTGPETVIRELLEKAEAGRLIVHH